MKKRGFLLSIFLHKKLAKQLKEIHSLLLQEPVDSIGDRYLSLHQIYTKLSEKQQRPFRFEMKKLQEKVEEQLTAKKRIEELLQRSHKGSIKQRHKCYEEIHFHYRKLPQKVQQHYYSHIVHLRQQLESGK